MCTMRTRSCMPTCIVDWTIPSTCAAAVLPIKFSRVVIRSFLRSLSFSARASSVLTRAWLAFSASMRVSLTALSMYSFP